MMKILIVEDEQAILELIRMNLERVGYQCDCASDGKQGADLLAEHDYDLVLLDIMLPEIDGYELLEYIEPLEIPVIFVTAKESVKDRVKGLHMGADDYLVKPFSIDELIARVKSVLRRYHKGIQVIHVLDVIIDTQTHQVKQNQQVVNLTNKEYDLLLYLVQNKNIALYREVLYEKVWGEEWNQSRTLDLHIQRLRKKLNWQDVIQTVFKIGYMLEVKQ